MRGCHRHCRHRQMVEDYRLARVAWEAKVEDACMGYDTEIREYIALHGAMTFKHWLTAGGWDAYRNS